MVLVMIMRPEAVDAAAAAARLQGVRPGSDITGTVRFEETGTRMKIRADIRGVPSGKHGLHIHEYGACSAQGGDAGGHFNPDDSPHGYLPRDGFERAHAGDFGNIDIDADGAGSMDLDIAGLSLHGGSHAIAGRAVILHAGADRFSQPAGEAGDRIACGTIKMVRSG